MQTRPQSIQPLASLWRSRWGYLFIAPAMLLLGIVHIWPIVRVIHLSFTQYVVRNGQQEWVGWNNYRNVFTDDLFYVAMHNTFIYTLLVVPLALAIALGLAYLVHPLGPKAQTFFKAAFYLPGIVSSVVLALVWAWLYNADFGLINYLLEEFIGIERVLWLGDTRFALLAVAIMTIASGLGVPLLLLLAAMGNIPDDYYEAAEIDGASRLRQFWSVTLPLLKPTLLYLIIVMTIGSFQVFDTVYLMTNGGPSYSTTTLVFLIYESAFRYFDFGQASAQAVVLFVMVVILAVVQFRMFSGDVEY
jgi:multiple sugar transport system permease protein